MVYRNYKIEVRPIECCDDGEYGRMFNSLDDLLDEDDINDWEYVYVIYSAEDSELCTPLGTDDSEIFEPWYDTVDDVVEAIDAALDDAEYRNSVTPYELELSSGDYACMLAEYEPSAEEAEDFISSTLEEGEHVVSVAPIDWDSAINNYNINAKEFEVLQSVEGTDDRLNDDEDGKDEENGCTCDDCKDTCETCSNASCNCCENHKSPPNENT